MMTLAQLAATSPNERPSGETVEQQELRIFNAINSQLANPALATSAEWSAVWVGLTQDRANLAYIAQNTTQNAFAVCLRGTQFNSLVDLAEDLNVASVAEFTAAPAFDQPLLVSQGSMQAFTEITNACFIPARTNLLQALQAMLQNAPSNPTLYITGHSLGGAMATMVALYLAAQSWSNAPTFGVYTFAAPTAGLQAFADCYDAVFPSNSFRVYNVWDIVPNAWVESDLIDVLDTFYPSLVSTPSGPGPAQNVGVNSLISEFIAAPGSNVYVQTNQTVNADPVNTATYGTDGTYDSSAVSPTMGDFLAQVSFQHNNYLAFVGAPSIPEQAPAVAATGTSIVPITPNSGPSGGGTAVTITGTNFTPDSMVDFGTVPALVVTVDSSTQITAIAPPLVGTVDVRVTTDFGTSPATPADRFTAPAPALAPAVTAVTPPSGPAEAGYSIVLTGTGFTSNCTVFFGTTEIDASDVTIMSLTEIVVNSQSSGSGTVPVTVTTTGSAGSAQTPTFTFGPAVVTSVVPDFGLYGPDANSAVKINGFGFGAEQGSGYVQFLSPPPSESINPGSSESAGKNPPKEATIQSWSDTQILAVPPYYGVMAGIVSQTVDVVVTTSAGASSTVSADEFTYYDKSVLHS